MDGTIAISMIRCSKLQYKVASDDKVELYFSVAFEKFYRRSTTEVMRSATEWTNVIASHNVNIRNLRSEKLELQFFDDWRPDLSIGSVSVSLGPIVNQIGKEVVISADMLCSSKNTKLGEVEIIAKFTANNPEVVAAAMPTTSVFSLFNNTEDSSSKAVEILGPLISDSESFGTIPRSMAVERQYSVYDSFKSKASEGATKEKRLLELYSEKAVQTEELEIVDIIDKSSQHPLAQSVDPSADYLIYGELDSKFLDTNQASFAGRMFHMDMLFPFELTTLDYLRRLFSCLVSGIRYPVVSVSKKHCAPNGPMRLLSRAETKDPVTLLTCILGKDVNDLSSVFRQTQEGTPEAKREFEVQCLFFMYLCARRSFVQSAQVLLRIALQLSKNEHEFALGGRLNKLSIPFSAARDLLECFASRFESCQDALEELIELQIQAERHRRSKEDRCRRLQLVWPNPIVTEKKSKTIEVLLQEYFNDPNVTAAANIEAERVKLFADLNTRKENAIKMAFNLVSAVKAAMESSISAKYRLSVRLKKIVDTLDTIAVKALSARRLESVKRLKELKGAIQKSYNVTIGKDENDISAQSADFQPAGALAMSSVELSEFLKKKSGRGEDNLSILNEYLAGLSTVSSELSIIEEEFLALSEVDGAHEVQINRITTSETLIQLSQFLDTPAPPMIITENGVNANDLYSVIGSDGHSIETLMFYSKCIKIVRSIARWPDLLNIPISVDKLDKVSDGDISDPKRLRSFDVAPSVLLRIGYSALDLLRAGYTKQELKSDGKISPEIFWECLLTLRDEHVTVSHCLLIGFTLKDLLEAEFSYNDILEGISQSNLFTPSKRDTTIRGSAPKPSQTVISGYTYKALRDSGLDCDHYALMQLYMDLDGPSWRRSDNWMSEKPIDQWLGVKCEEIKGIKRVVQIDLRSNLLRGEVGKSMEYLDSLERLDFSHNMISGAAGKFLSLFVNLKDVWLLGNPDIAENADYSLKSNLSKVLPSTMTVRFDSHDSNSVKGKKDVDESRSDSSAAGSRMVLKQSSTGGAAGSTVR